MALKKRVEVLFDEQKYSYLEHLAKREKTSVGHLVREAVTVMYLEKQVELGRGALKEVLESKPVDFGPDWAETSWQDFKQELADDRVQSTMKGMNGGRQS